MSDDYFWLQPLRIPEGWEISYNQFYEIDPVPEQMHYFDSPSLLMMYHQRANLLLDMFWKPESDPEGEFQLWVYPCLQQLNPKTHTLETKTLWEEPLFQFHTRERGVLVEKIERYLIAFKRYEDPRILKGPGETDEPSESLRLKMLEVGLTPNVFAEIVEKGNQIIQLMVIDHKEVSPEMLSVMTEKAMKPGLRKKAQDILNSRRFRQKNGLD